MQSQEAAVPSGVAAVQRRRHVRQAVQSLAAGGLQAAVSTISGRASTTNCALPGSSGMGRSGGMGLDTSSEHCMYTFCEHSLLLSFLFRQLGRLRQARAAASSPSA